MRILITLILTVFALSVFMPFVSADAAPKKTQVRHRKKIVHIKKAKALRLAPSKVERLAQGKIEKKTEWRKAVTGSVHITSQATADIYFDNDIIGKAPVSVEGVIPGRHIVEAYTGKDLIYRKYIVVKPLSAVAVEINGEKEIAEEDPDFII